MSKTKRYLSITILSVALLSGMVFSCKKWEDPVSTEQPQVSNPYCNDPDAINYNWGFPGKPDNTTCIYAPDLFAGTYTFRDTIYSGQSDLYLYADLRTLTMTKASSTRLWVSGLCEPGLELRVSARAAYYATIDSTIGDTLSERRGQQLCRVQDTVTGTFTRDKVDSSLVYISFTVITDTGSTLHVGRAIRHK